MDEAPDQPINEFNPTETPTSIFEQKPKTRKPRSDSTPLQGEPRRGRVNKHTQRKDKVETLLATVGGAVAFFEQYDGQVIMMHSANVAEALASVADTNTAVANALDKMSTGGAYGALLLAIAGMVLPILTHHELIPPFVSQMLVPQEPNAEAA